MKTCRRDFLKGVLATGAAAGAAPTRAHAWAGPERNGLGMLIDSTRCIGCKACMAACKRANDMPPEHSGERALQDQAVALSAKTLTVITATEDEPPAYLKLQCMHCIEPACVSVCMLEAFHKDADGIVAYDPARCIGCRYCQIACPFNVPKFEWDERLPQMRKCELCRHLETGPACAEVCPRAGIVVGPRDELLAEARRRIAREPDRYVDHIYGEHEAGGTQVLYLSSVPFEATSLPPLDDQPAAGLAETVQHGIYRGFAAPVALYAILCGVLWRQNHSKTAVTKVPLDQESCS